MATMLFLATLSVLIPCGLPPVHVGVDIDGWRREPTGGHPPTLEPAVVRGEAALRLRYTHQAPGWGHAAKDVTVPPDACAIRLRVFRLLCRAGAGTHIWLFEPDGDGWMAEILHEKGAVPWWPEGWVDIDVPLQRMRYDPRGNRIRELASARRLLIGFTGADTEIAIARIEWRTHPAALQPKATRPAVPPAVRAGSRATIALFRDARYAAIRDDRCMPSDPDHRASILQRRGYGTVPLDAEQMASPDILDAARFPVLILPYGPAYPAAAEEAIRRYLSRGGCFFSTGG